MPKKKTALSGDRFKLTMSEYKKTGIIFLIIIVIFSFGVLLAMMGYTAKHEGSMGWWTETATKLDKTNIVDDEIKDWKIYKNEAYGYELKYPASWDVQEGLSNNKMDFISSGSIILSIGVFPERILEIADCTDYPTDEGQCEEIIIDGEKYMIESYDWEVVNLKYPFGGIINIASKSIENEDKKIFRSILSTFKLDQNTGWKTYRSEKYGFELQYPRSLILSENDNYDGDNDQMLDKKLLTLNKISNDNFLTINRFEIGKNETYKDVITDNSWLLGGGTGRVDFSKFKLVKIGDNPYYYRYFCGDPSGSVEDGTAACGFYYYYWLASGQDVYEFELSETLPTAIEKSESENYENTLSHQEMKDILSTFKFIEKDLTVLSSGINSDKKEDSSAIWMRYSDNNGSLIPDADIKLVLTSPEKYEYEAKYSEEDNRYYVTLFYVSKFKDSYCFKVSAAKDGYKSQEMDLGCIALSEYINKEIYNINNWEIYRNEKYGFEFKYPNSIMHKSGQAETSIEISEGVPFCDPEDTIELGRDKIECQSNILFNAILNSNLLIRVKEKPVDFIDLKKYVEKTSERIQEETKTAAAPSVVEFYSTIINNEEGFVIKVNRQNATEYKHEYIYLEKDKNIYIIGYDYLNGYTNPDSSHYDYDQKVQLDKIKEVISTLKFIEADNANLSYNYDWSSKDCTSFIENGGFGLSSSEKKDCGRWIDFGGDHLYYNSTYAHS
ncbi:MAG: hypothetical protein WA063_04055 [Minisyncoccia bacterium]